MNVLRGQNVFFNIYLFIPFVGWSTRSWKKIVSRFRLFIVSFVVKNPGINFVNPAGIRVDKKNVHNLNAFLFKYLRNTNVGSYCRFIDAAWRAVVCLNIFWSKNQYSALLTMWKSRAAKAWDGWVLVIWFPYVIALSLTLYAIYTMRYGAFQFLFRRHKQNMTPFCWW